LFITTCIEKHSTWQLKNGRLSMGVGSGGQGGRAPNPLDFETWYKYSR